MSTLTLYFIPSPRPIDWSSPTSLARSLVKNQIIRKSRFMGHANVQLEHKGEKHLTGMAAKNIDEALGLLLKKKIGMGIVYHSFDGHLETKEELRPELDSYFKAGNRRINFIQFKISKSMGDKVQQYLEDFEHHKIYKYYGLVNSPLFGEGSGCSAFAASTLILMGQMSPELIAAWSQTVRIPLSLIGAPVTDRKVGFLKIFLKKHEWAASSEPHKELHFWDPDLMWSWVEQQLSNDNYEKTNIQNAKGILLDLSHVEASTTPSFKMSPPKSALPNLQNQSNRKEFL